MQLENFFHIKNAISEVDFILVGLGEEWVMSQRDIVRHLAECDLVLQKLFVAAEENKDYEKLLPIFTAYYYQKYMPEYMRKAYINLLNLVENKNYFIVSLTVDSYFKKIGFDSERCVNPCGSYENLQCNSGCDETLTSSNELMRQIENLLESHHQNDLNSQQEVEEVLLSCIEVLNTYKCVKCNADMKFNLLDTIKYREEGYLQQWQRYMKWLQGTLNKNLCVIEAGVGMKLPSVIRWPFEKTVFYNQKSKMFRIHEKYYQVNEEIAERAFGCKCNAVQLFGDENVEAF